jgi:glucose/galactose transporter
MTEISTAKASSKSSYLLSISLIGALFFIFGFVTWLNGILIPYLKIACELSDFQALLVTFSFYISYTIMALPSSWVLKKTGFRNGMMVGLWVMAIGTLIFIPAAMTRTYGIFLTGLFVMGAGLALLQTASNPYITIIGPVESAASRISIMGIANKLAGAIAPLILAYFILNDGDEFVKNIANMVASARIAALDGLARRVINPYIIMTIVLVLMGFMIRFSPLPEIETEQEDEATTTINSKKTSILQFPNLVLGVITLFFYVGAEVIAGDTIIRYGLSLGIKMEVAKVFYYLYHVIDDSGYILGIVLIPKYISLGKGFTGIRFIGLVFSILILITDGYVSIIFVALLGLANALVWPAVWPLALHGLGRFIKTGSALLIMAIAGGALLPLAWGWLSDAYHPNFAYIILIPCYLIIWLYAWRLHKIKDW